MECWCGDSWKQAGDKTEGTNPYLLLHSEFTSKSTWKPSVSSLLAHFIFHRSPPFPGLPTLNFLTKFHTDLVVSWLFVWGTLPAGLICLLLQKTNLSSISPCVTGLTNKLLSKFYTDSCKLLSPFYMECFLQAGMLKKMKYKWLAAVWFLEMANGIFSC